MNCNGFNEYDISDPVELLAQLSFASSGAPYDPAVVRVKILAPGNVLSSYVYGTDGDLLRNAAGAYSLITFPTIAGPYLYRWEIEDSATDARVGAQEGRFMVRRSMFVPGVPPVSNGGSGHGFDGGTP